MLQRGRRHAEHSLKSIRDCDSPELANVRLTAEQLEQLAKTAEAEGYACRAAKLMDAVSVSSADDERAPKELLKKARILLLFALRFEAQWMTEALLPCSP